MNEFYIIVTSDSMHLNLQARVVIERGQRETITFHNFKKFF